MSTLATKKAMATALAGAAIASSLAAPAVSARPVGWAAAYASDSPTVPPPPSLIAASAAEESEELRSPGAAPPESQPVGDGRSPSNGFDLPSAAIGAAAGTGLVIVLLAAGGLARRGPLTRSHRAAGA